MSEVTGILLSAVCGLAAGAVFFGGLWFSVSRVVRSSHRMGLVLGSFLLRSAVTVGLAWVAVQLAGQWGILLFLITLTAVRFLLIGVARRKRANNA